MLRNDQTGAALPLILVIVLGMSVFAVTLLVFSLNETRQVALDENQLKAQYLARSGAHAVADYIINNPDDVLLILDQESGDVELGEGYYRVIVTDQSTADETLYRITSTGVVKGISQKIDVTVESKGIDAALYANLIDITGQGQGNGGIYGADVVYGVNEEDLTAAQIAIIEDKIKGEYDLRFGHHEFDSVILPCADEEVKTWFNGGGYDITTGCPPLNDPASIKTNKIDRILDESKSYNLIDVENNDTLTIGSEWVTDDILIKAGTIDTSNSSIVVELNNNTIIIVADYFYPSGKGNGPGILVKDVSGTDAGGHLMIYCHEFINGGNTSIKVDEGSDNVYVNVYVYVKDGNGGYFDIQGTPHFYGSIYAPDARAVLTGNASVQGWVIADKAYLTGNSDLVYSPVQSLKTSMSFEFFNIKRWTYLDYVDY